MAGKKQASQSERKTGSKKQMAKILILRNELLVYSDPTSSTWFKAPSLRHSSQRILNKIEAMEMRSFALFRAAKHTLYILKSGSIFPLQMGKINIYDQVSWP